MDLIIGGAYQGKLAYAMRRYRLPPEEIYALCADGGELDFTKKCVRGIEEFTWRCACRGEDAVEIFRSRAAEWSRCVLICGDISSGVVPMGAENRAWREMNGRLCAYLAAEAETVTRMFCGIAQRLK